MSSLDRLAVDHVDGIAALTVALERSWPMLVTLTPDSLGLGSDEDGSVRFLTAVRHLSDEGLMSYEALIVNGSETRLVDAALTARGRETLRRG